MNGRNGEARLREALKRGTDQAALNKERVWRAVSRGIAETKHERGYHRMKRKARIVPLMTGALATTAVVVLAVFFTLTPEGADIAGRIKGYFSSGSIAGQPGETATGTPAETATITPAASPQDGKKTYPAEKDITVDIEGQAETVSATLNGDTSREIGYIIYIDESRYAKESRDGADYYKALNVPDDYPPVQMEIRQLPQESAEAAYTRVLAESGIKYDVADGKKQVDSPVKGWSLIVYDNGGGDKPYVEVFFVDNTAGGCFVIQCSMFSEAAEGHGARFEAMLKTFEVVESSRVDLPSPSPSQQATSVPAATAKLTWDGLAFGGAKLGMQEQDAIDEMLKFVCLNGGTEAPVSDETANDAGGTTRTIQWGDGTVAAIRNGKLYSLETTNPVALMPNGLHAGLSLEDFKATLGAPREVPGEFAWGVGSDDNLFVRVQNGIVISVRMSLVE
jgi:hypothetical protein